ncbi:MAG: ATP cone domain-containing protein [Planctomycetota bacterium]|nr:ATP cone domain-containing protein [Planctomycetota bacterium]
MIQVRKRDGSIEPFQQVKITRALWSVIEPGGGHYLDARHLAEAIEIYLERDGDDVVSTAAVFEMALKVLHRTGMVVPACALEAHRACRALGRKQLMVVHEPGKATYWDKSWLSSLAQRSWRLATPTARIVAAQVEAALLASAQRTVTREDVIDLLNAAVSSFGLADAVPVEQPV